MTIQQHHSIDDYNKKIFALKVLCYTNPLAEMDTGLFYNPPCRYCRATVPLMAQV